MRRELYGNIVLLDGTMMFPVMGEMMNKEIAALSPVLMKVISPEERKYVVLVRGSILTLLATFQQIVITKGGISRIIK